MPSFRDGQTNILGIVNPGVYVDQILPTPFVGGVPSNIEGIGGVASWGPVGSPQLFNTADGGTTIFGKPQIRVFDLMTHVLAGLSLGSSIGYAGVRVTDGTDTAATASIQGGGTATARYTGSLGNSIAIAFQGTNAAGAYAVVVSFPGRTPERWDNILQALQSLTLTPGTGYTSVPTLVLSAPQQAGGVPAQVQATLQVVGTPTITAGGQNHAVNDVVTAGNGVKLTVTSVSAGAITGVSVQNPGSITSGAVPSTVGQQTASTGAGTGAVFGLGFGLGPARIVSSGFGYTSITAQLQGGGGTGGSYAPILSFWAAASYAINTGTSQRGRSRYVVFSPSASTAAPSLNISTLLSGGTDGASGVTTAMMIGQDILPRTGMYALRKTGCDAFALADVTDPTTWATQLAFAISEGTYAVTATANGDTIANCVATRQGIGVDDPSIKIIEGDWPSFYDSVNGLTRLVSPTAFALGLFGNLSPEQGTINKPLVGVVATQTSSTGVLIADADEAVAQTGGIDVIGKSGALGADYFTFLTGRNSSSNTAANGDEYTRLTNYLTKLLQGAATRSIVGKLQSVRADDPTRAKAKNVLDSLFQDLVNPNSGSDGYGMIDSFAVTCDLTNNTPTTIARGFLFAFCAVRYLGVVRYFVIRLQGGNNVTVSVQAQAPTLYTALTAVAA